MNDQTCYDENTLFKVNDALKEAGLDIHQRQDAINQMQNKGILFRESCDAITNHFEETTN